MAGFPGRSLSGGRSSPSNVAVASIVVSLISFPSRACLPRREAGAARSAAHLRAYDLCLGSEDVDDVATPDGALQDGVEHGLEPVEGDVVDDLVETLGLEGAAELLPHVAPEGDRRLDRVDAEEGDASQDEGEHRRREAGAAGQPTRLDRAPVFDASQHVGEGLATDAVDGRGPPGGR